MRSGPTTVTRQRRSGRPAGDDHQPRGRKRPPLARFERHGRVPVNRGFLSQRMMHERDESQARGFAFHLGRHRAERQAVDQHRGVVRNLRQHAGGLVSRR